MTEFPHSDPKPARVLYAREDQTDEDVRAEHVLAPGEPVIIFRTKDARRHPNRIARLDHESH